MSPGCSKLERIKEVPDPMILEPRLVKLRNEPEEVDETSGPTLSAMIDEPIRKVSGTDESDAIPLPTLPNALLLVMVQWMMLA
jgi:hypothetical protein